MKTRIVLRTKLFIVIFIILFLITCSSVPIYIRVFDVLKDQGMAISFLEERCSLLEDEVAYMENPIIQVIENKTELTQSERELIERVVAAEARGESLEGMMAVAQTIKDRGDLWGRTYIDICTQSGQFADPYGGALSNSVVTAVHLVFDLGYRVTVGPTTHFYNWTVINPPYWTKNKEFIVRIGAHDFYY